MQTETASRHEHRYDHVARTASSRRLLDDQRGHGAVSIVKDGDDGYRCSWYAGAASEDLIECARVPSTTDAVSWGRARTPRVQLRMSSTEVYWAGSDPRPAWLTHSWPHPPAPQPVTTSEAARAEPRDLHRVRRRLDTLATTRANEPWTQAETDEYRRLGDLERRLLVEPA